MVAPAASSLLQGPPHRRGRWAPDTCRRFSDRRPSARSLPRRHNLGLGRHTTSSCTHWGPATSWSLDTRSRARGRCLSGCILRRTRGWRRTPLRWSSPPAASGNIRTSPRTSGSPGRFCRSGGKRRAARLTGKSHNRGRRCDTTCSRTHLYPAKQDHLCTRLRIACQHTANCKAHPFGSHPKQVPKNSPRSTTGQRCYHSSQ
mmetsp:Transcript_16006/g.40645  ORF Transcript_16006/g.40645 Transcript_16006/m.40645 type:complete len:202 (+) Transcript_16006:189-794(+)